MLAQGCEVAPPTDLPDETTAAIREIESLAGACARDCGTCGASYECGVWEEPCADGRDCVPDTACWSSTCVREGSLRVSLSWTVSSDFDLHVRTPSGEEISYANRSVDGGQLDLDDCASACRDPSGTHVENIFWTSAAPSGTYEVWAVNYDGASSGAYTLAVDVAATGSWSGVLPAVRSSESTHFTFRVP